MAVHLFFLKLPGCLDKDVAIPTDTYRQFGTLLTSWHTKPISHGPFASMKEVHCRLSSVTVSRFTENMKNMFKTSL